MENEITTQSQPSNFENMDPNTVLTSDTNEEHVDLAEDESLDFQKLSKGELYKYLLDYKIDDNYGKSNNILKQFRSHFDAIAESERNAALQKFIENGSEEGDFDFKKDELTLKFDKAFDEIRDKLTQLHTNQEKEKDKNFEEKKDLLDKLRALISLEETSTSITTLKELQERWKKIGQVPAGQAQALWASYNALIERFYNNRSIYFELKELDRKKNLEAKYEIVDKAEKLANSDSINQAIRDLKTLHEEYKHIGPVPKEDQEKLWERFKLASDAIYEKRNQHFDKLKSQQEENYNKKVTLVEKIDELSQFESGRIDDWKLKTADVLALQEKWKKSGPAPPDKAKEISKKFWNACKAFFNKKNAFFKTLEQRKEENLKLKLVLCEKVEELKDSDDYAPSAKLIKEYQKEWDLIGAVPLKEKENIFKRFKAACDFFFNKKRESFAETEKIYEANLARKIEICESIEKLSSEETPNLDELKTLQHEWNGIGFVPKAEIKNILERYNKAINSFLKSLDQKDGSIDKDERLSFEVAAMKNNPDASKKLYKKESDIQRKISSLKSEIDRYNTNMDFLAYSPKAEVLKKDIGLKIEAAQKEMKLLEQQIKIIRQG